MGMSSYEAIKAKLAHLTQSFLNTSSEYADLRSKVANLTETLDKIVGVLASQGLVLDGEHLPPLKKPRYDRQDSEQLFLERLPSSVRGVAPLDFAPHSLDGLATSPRLADAR